MEHQKFDFFVKTVIVGDSGVGKSCILLRFIRDAFDEHSQPTLGVEFMTKVIETKKHRIELQLYDTAGQELFKSVTRCYYRGSSGAFIVFDLTRKQTFANVERWLEDVKNVASDDIVTVLLGNKSDLQDQREVTFQEASTFAASHQMKYYEVSARNGQNIKDAILDCVNLIDERTGSGRLTLPSASDSIIFGKEQQQERSGCC